MNLEMFQYVDEIIEVYESKRDIYKLIADEIQSYFEKHVFDKSKYTFNIIYRLKTVNSIKEKLLEEQLYFTIPQRRARPRQFFRPHRSAHRVQVY